MKLTTKNVQAVEEVPYGVYVWRCPDGEYLGQDGNVMNIFCMKGDRQAIKALRDAAKSYGYEEGEPEWWSGARPVTDEEYEEQQLRQKMGLTPDPYDIGAMADELRAMRRDR